MAIVLLDGVEYSVERQPDDHLGHHYTVKRLSSGDFVGEIHRLKDSDGVKTYPAPKDTADPGRTLFDRIVAEAWRQRLLE